MESKSKLNVIRFKRRPLLSKQDFTLEHHGSIVLLKPNTRDGIDWANAKIGRDNGLQPLWPVAVLEPRYVNEIVSGIRADGLLVR
jgi:hypothetical protein